jgi:aromatic amino acid aminotransferase I
MTASWPSLTITDIYTKRALMLVDFLNKYAPLSTIEIPAPSGGMFLWVRLRVESHPDYPAKTPQQISQQVFETMIEEKVLACPGHYFKAPSVTEAPAEEDSKNIFIRMSYSLPPPEEMEEGVKRFSKALTREWKL